MVDEDGAGLHAGKRAIGPEHHAAKVVVIADTGHHELGAMGGLGGRAPKRAAMLRDPGLGLCRRAIIDAQLMALRRQMPRHRIAHHAQPQKRHFRHLSSSAHARAGALKILLP